MTRKNFMDRADEVVYQCKENDNHIKIQFCAGLLEEFHIGDASEGWWTVIGFQDMWDMLESIGYKVVRK